MKGSVVPFRRAPCLQALLARAPDAVILAYLRSPAYFALALAALLGADARSQALLVRAADALVLAVPPGHP